MKFDIERLYSLLPAIHRLKDHELAMEGENPPLKAFLSIIAEEIELLEENLDQLYDDQFIETCSEWVVPYIGEIIGFQPLISIKDDKYSLRSEAANTISYRRRKGTLSIIEQLARDVTNWDANVVEYFRSLATTQYMNHLRPENISVPDLKKWEQLEYVNTPFDSIPRSAEVRNIRSKRGKFNIPNIGIFLWRIQAFPRSEAHAFQIDDLKYTFHPLGIDTPLYNYPQAESSIADLANPFNMPMKLKRRLLKKYIEKQYGPDGNLFIKIGEERDIDITEICIGDLSNWDEQSVVPPSDFVTIDPLLGRFMFGSDFTTLLDENDVFVWYHYGALNQMGGGEYSRKNSFSNIETIIRVSQDAGAGDFDTIQEAFTHIESGEKNVVIEITDNYSYHEDLEVQLSEGQTIEIRAAEGKNPAIILTGEFIIQGEPLSHIILNGLLIDGGNIHVIQNTSLDQLTIKHCGIRPDEAENRILLDSSVNLSVEYSVISRIKTFNDTVLLIENSIIDVENPAGKAITGDTNLTVKNSTITGEVDVKSIHFAENTIFNSKVVAEFLQKGCIRFSYVTSDSITPPKYDCYPDDSSNTDLLLPIFASKIFGHPDYYQLDKSTDKIFLKGADDGSEIGVYHNLFQQQKVSNLKTRLDEYMRFGMVAGIFYAS